MTRKAQSTGQEKASALATFETAVLAVGHATLDKRTASAAYQVAFGQSASAAYAATLTGITANALADAAKVKVSGAGLPKSAVNYTSPTAMTYHVVTGEILARPLAEGEDAPKIGPSAIQGLVRKVADGPGMAKVRAAIRAGKSRQDILARLQSALDGHAPAFDWDKALGALADALPADGSPIDLSADAHAILARLVSAAVVPVPVAA